MYAKYYLAELALKIKSNCMGDQEIFDKEGVIFR